MQLKGKTVFITGGAGGIGSAFARTMMQNGAQVCIADIDESKGVKMAVDLNAEFEENKAMFIKCNVADETGFRDVFGQAVKTFGRVDVMVNNAGVLDESSWQRMLAINLNGTILGSNIALAHMRKDKGGRGGVIVNMSSIAGYRPEYLVPVYAASKHGIIGFTRSLATSPDINEQGVRFACICPDTTDTPLSQLTLEVIRDGYFDCSQLQETNEKHKNSIRPETVAEGLLSLIADDDSNDSILQISLEVGLVRKRLTMVDA